ncbi:PAS domain S-box-containing protein [Loktanella fryxellensis]|uniref:PAS domain S-box-containing protein n=1 Tax=Loktanella fryxellensis TaxID=245187 RepID=A0A1H8CLL3_9RHOB|nr:PAS domain-containing protein [Loktanella fryxellensis]SEM95789.1 PAS domain S-box-containing protein [Loktanella fryxellensis]
MATLNIEEVAQRLDKATVSMSIADAAVSDMPLVYVNPAFCAVTGYDASDMIGRNCRFLQADLDNEDPRHIVREALDKGTGAQAVFRNRRRDGSEFNNLLILEPLHDRAGALAYVVGAQFVMDRTTRPAMAAEHGLKVVHEIDKLLALNDRLRATSRQALARSMAATVRLWLDR